MKAEIIDNTTNQAIVQLPGRNFPAACIQGDQLKSIMFYLEQGSAIAAKRELNHIWHNYRQKCWKEIATPTHDELKEQGELIEHKTGDTWNDGGHWNNWVYLMDGRYWVVLQETDYRPDVTVEEVFRREKVVTTYGRRPTDGNDRPGHEHVDQRRPLRPSELVRKRP